MNPFSSVIGYHETIKKISAQRAQQLDQKIRDNIEGSTIQFFDVEYQEWDEGHPDYTRRNQTIIRIATDSEPVEDQLFNNSKATYQTNRFKWKITVLPWTDEDEKKYFDYDWHKNERWKNNSSEQTNPKEEKQ